MADDWVKNNIEKIDVADLEKLEQYTNYRTASVFFGFFVGLYPQYTLISHPFVTNYKKNGILSRLSIVALFFLPLSSSYLISRPMFYMRESYISSLKEKFK